MILGQLKIGENQAACGGLKHTIQNCVFLKENEYRSYDNEVHIFVLQKCFATDAALMVSILCVAEPLNINSHLNLNFVFISSVSSFFCFSTSLDVYCLHEKFPPKSQQLGGPPTICHPTDSSTSCLSFALCYYF